MIDVLRGILKFIETALGWVVDFFQWLIAWWWGNVLDALLYVLNQIPVPTWLDELAGNVSGIDPGVLYFVEPLQLGTGLTWVLSAYVIRFVIRRIPLIG